MSLRISSLAIENTYGIEKIAFPLGTVTMISGDNGTGKSSIVNALLRPFEGGADKTCLRPGKKSLITMTLSDGTIYYKSTWIAEDGSLKTKLEATDPAGITIPSPKEALAELAEVVAVNPARLLRLDTSTAAGKRALAAELLETMPITFIAEDFSIAAPKQLDGKTPIPAAVKALEIINTSRTKKTLGLDELATLRKGIEDTRRKVGVEVKENEAAASQLSKSLPSVSEGEDAIKQVEKLASQIAELKSAEHVEEQAIRDDFAADERKIRAEIQTKLDALAVERTAALRELEQKAAVAVNALESERSVLQERADAAKRAAGARKTIEQMWERQSAKAAEYETFTAAIRILDAAKQAKLEHLPIPGLTFDDGEVSVDGVNWSAVNTARKVEVAVQHACLRGGELPLIVEDDAEHLGAETKKALTDALVGAGYQVVFAAVKTGEPLTITTEVE